jgi:hypothetical protein
MQSERGNAQSSSDANIVRNSAVAEQANARGVYTAECWRVEDAHLPRALKLRRKLDAFANLPHGIPLVESRIKQLQEEFDAVPRYLAWSDTYENLVTTAGKNDMLDKYLSGSAYTAAFYLGLISSVGYTAIAAADTMASHAGWTEAGITNAPTYSQAARPTAAWSAASAGSKALSSSLAYSFTGAGTIKGSFLTTVSTKDGTTGILVSAGLFTGGDRVVANLDTVNVAYSLGV